MPTMSASSISDTVNSQCRKEDIFTRYEFGTSGRSVIPSLVYIRPDDLEHVRIMVGPNAEVGEQKYPIRKQQLVFGNLKSLFKSDLVLSEKEPGWKYRFDRNLGYAETNALEVTQEFIRGLFFEGFNGLNAKDATSPIYVGKPAYSDPKFERRYEKRIRQIFANLSLPDPAFVYEPYAIYYYCRFLLRMDFIHDSSKKGARVLIIDHGGGTINTCLVELNRQGAIRSARPKSPQASHGGGSYIDQFILRKKIREANFVPEVRKKIIDNDRLVFPRLAEVLGEVEKAKMAFSSGDFGGSTELTVSLGIDNGPSEWTFSISEADFEEAFSYIWDRHCRNAIAATLGSDDTRKVDYVILSGGSCRLGHHEKYLRRDFGTYLRQLETTFIDISLESKPVAFGLCFQSLLDKIKSKKIHTPIPTNDTSTAQSTNLQEEDLSDYVARNLMLKIHGECGGIDRLYGEAILARSGTPKEELWNREQRIGVKLLKKLPSSFRFGVHPEDQLIEVENSTETYPISVRRNMANEIEKSIDVGFLVNDDGLCKPRFYLSPHRHPNYFEPSKVTFRIDVPDLARRTSKSVTSVSKPAPPTQVLLGFDFGTSMSSVVGLDRDVGVDALLHERAFFSGDYIQRVASSQVTVETVDVRKDDAHIMRLLENVGTDIARTYHQVISDLQAPRYSYKGTAAELRATIEMVLERLAPDDEVQRFGIKPDPVLKKVGLAARATYILKSKRSKDEVGAKKCAESINIIETGIGDVLRGVHKRASKTVHMEAQDEREEVLHLDGYFRVLMNDLLD